jgi:uncharacterized repeat protein (TIGR02543 family)
VEHQSYSYDDDGTFTVSLTVTDDDGATDSVSQSVSVGNVAPSAGFTFEPASPNVTDLVYFNSTGTDSDGSIVNWTWNLGDGTTCSGQHIVHRYSEAGAYRVILTVIDDDGTGNANSHVVNIGRHAFILATSVDPPGAGSVSLSPSGGSYDTGTVITLTASPSPGYIFDHWSGDSSGTSTSVDVTMIEDKSVTAFFTPLNRPPNVSVAAPANGSGVSGVVVVEGSAGDDNGSVQSVEVRVDDGSWDVADGTGSWTYRWDTATVDNGNHTIRVRSYDGKDYSDVVSIPVRVSNNRLPSVEITSPRDGARVNGTVVFTGTASDSDGNETLQAPEIQIEHDGNIHAWTPVAGTTSWRYTWNTTEDENGAYTISMRVSDGDACSNISSIVLTVDNDREQDDAVPGFKCVLLLVAVCIAVALLRRKRAFC